MPRNNVDALIRTLSQVRPGPVDATKLRQAMASLTDVVPRRPASSRRFPAPGPSTSASSARRRARLGS